MPKRLSIRLEVPGVPPGSIPLSDLAKIADAIQVAVQRLVAHDSGLPEGSGLSADVREASTLLLTGITQGSTILECEPKLGTPVVGETPAIEASTHLVSGIAEHARSGIWPRYLPGNVRQHLGARLATVIKKDDTAYLTISGSSTKQLKAAIDFETRVDLQRRDEVPSETMVTAVGEMYEANKSNRTFRIRTDPGTMSICVDASMWGKVDDLLWRPVKVIGQPLDSRARKLGMIRYIGEATSEDPVGVHLPNELTAAVNSEAYQSAIVQFKNLALLQQDWDSYGGKPPAQDVLDNARDFFHAACKVLLRYDITPPKAFITVTSSGNPQFEWSIDGRDLELELTSGHHFAYLISAAGRDFEGQCEQREAIRFVRWIATGE